MAILNPIGVDQTTGQSRSLKAGDMLNGSLGGFDFLNIGSTSAAVAIGDLAASDGTREMFWDASLGRFNLRQTTSEAGSTGDVIYLNRDNAATIRVQTAGLSGSGFFPAIGGDGSNGTIASKTISADGDVTLNIFARLYTGAAFASNAGINFEVDGTPTGSSSPGRIRFATTISGATSPIARWAITNAGHFLTIADNTYDIGASGATRPRTGYFGTDVVVDGAALPRVLARIAAIDLAATGDTALYTVPTGQSAVIVSIIVRPTTATAAGGDAIVSVGTNASTYDDIISAQTLTGLDATTESFTIEVGGISHTGAATEVIRFQVDTADTGTALVATIDLIGYLI